MPVSDAPARDGFRLVVDGRCAAPANRDVDRVPRRLAARGQYDSDA